MMSLRKSSELLDKLKYEYLKHTTPSLVSNLRVLVDRNFRGQTPTVCSAPQSL